MMEPSQLSFLAGCVDKTRHLPGPIVEVGCYVGATTIWLNRHMDAEAIDKPYVAIDTFSGFMPADVEHEVNHRGKRPSIMAFEENDQSWFDTTMRLNGITRVRSIKANASGYDYSQLKDISFALIDVDLFVPVRAALAGVWPRMADGGIIVVDDCAPDTDADGALDAYLEFVAEKGIETSVVHRKLGVIEVGQRSSKV